MREAQVSGPHLAAAIGIKPQGFTNMRRKPNASMAPELIAHAAVFLQCDLYWLCTGEGGDYVPHQNFGKTARSVAKWIDEMTDDDRSKAYAFVNLMRQGQWPTFADDAPARLDR